MIRILVNFWWGFIWGFFFYKTENSLKGDFVFYSSVYASHFFGILEKLLIFGFLNAYILLNKQVFLSLFSVIELGWIYH